ncbi:hypothetical protein [Marinivivus vitaminiproducens]|uniref:hypothetical protein n=1 Tax=Marinivivus vitaminiproducens TaxID=3035935 RepID=UPI00279C5280|nr:hypothetical protein P4R82_09060 [Geminicoccaceae bacterium SCSIO 64248]
MSEDDANEPVAADLRPGLSRRTVILRTAGMTAIVTLSCALAPLQAAALPDAVPFDDGTWWDDGTGWVD